MTGLANTAAARMTHPGGERNSTRHSACALLRNRGRAPSSPRTRRAYVACSGQAYCGGRPHRGGGIAHDSDVT